MASIAHLAAGAACGAVYARKTGTRPLPTIAAFSALALAPDLDLFALPFRPSGTPLEHRVMTHSLPFAVGAGVAAVAVGTWVRNSHAMALGMLVALALASHGILDSMTAVGHAPRILWPFTWQRFAMPWQPLPGVASFQGYFSLSAVRVFVAEGLWSAPFLATVVWALRKSGGASPTRVAHGREGSRQARSAA